MDRPVEMKELTFQYFPKRFVANGTEYVVKDVVKSWTNSEQPKAYLGFQVRCENETIDLYLDVKKNTWYMTRMQ